MGANLDKVKSDIFNRINIQSELENVGIQFIRPANSKGWAACLNPYKTEKNASCGINVNPSDPAAGYLVMFNMPGRNGDYAKTSFWDLMADFKPGMGGNWLKVLEYYAEQTNVKMIKKKKRDIEPPSQAMVDRFIKKLTPDVRQYLRDKRGFTDETIEKFQIGWDPKRGRNSYPVFDKDGEVVNIRFHNSKKKPKTMSISGYGEARIYNAQALVEAKDNETIVITEGECYDPEIAHVLTPDGWVRLIDYCNQKVLQITPDGMSEFVQPIAYIIKPHKKALCTYACDDFFSATTRDHNMVLYNKLTSQFEKYRADDLPTKDDHFRLPNSTQLYGGPGLGKKTMAKIRLAMAIDIVGTKTFNKSTGIENVVFDFNDQYEDVEYRRYCVDRLDEILDGTKIETEDYVYENGRIKITFDLGDWYNEYRNFKFRWIPDASIAERRNLMNEMDFWHRQETPHTWRYEFNTDNYNNAVFVQTLAHTCGLMSEVMKVDNVNYYIVIFNSRRQTINANRVKKGYRHTKSGLVACVQVPSGMILTRQRETISIGGNCDAIIVSQETGLKAVSPTNGCATFMPGWVDEFKNKNVVLLYDADQQGRNAVKSLVLPMFKRAVLSGDVRSIKAMWLFENEDKSNKDATDWFVKAGGTKAQFMEQMAAAKNYVFKAPSLVLPKPINLKSFVDVENSDFVGKRISVPIYIYGENSETYHAVNEVKVTFCPKLESGGCVGRADWDWQCADPIMIQQGSRIQLACVQTSDAQVKNAMREYICDKGRNPSINIAEKNRTTIRELFAHQVFKERIGTETGELVEKTIYNIGNDVVPIGQYQATGFVHSNPKNQKPTMIIDGMTKQDEDWQAFNLEESRQYLRDIQPMDIMEIVDDLADNVTRIYSREDLHIGMLLTLCSPQWIDFPGDGRIRGWISSVTIGDSGCHAKGTEILMVNGDIKKVEDITVGESIMGPDSNSKVVQKLYRGSEKMYKITPVKGESFVVNENHILSLKTTPRTYQKKKGVERTEINITVKEYLKKGVLFKGLHKLYRSEAVEFQNNNEPITIDPYFLGLYIGDGVCVNEHRMAPSITTADIEILQETYKQMIKYKLRATKQTKPNNKASAYNLPNAIHNHKITNKLGVALCNLGVSFICAERSVPINYKTGSIETRLEILAGLLDSDGHLSSNTSYEFSSKSIQLAKDVAFISRSVGLAAYISIKPVNNTDYYRVNISGHANKIPCRIKRKKAKIRKQIKDVLVTGFSVEPVGIDNFYGFELGGDHLYVMGDFTVTHNTGKSFCAEKMLNHAGVGYRVSGMTASRTGITYAIDRDETHGWRIKAGAMLKMSRQALIVDEAQDLEEHDIKTMADAMDTGKLSIDRVENRTFEAMTRCLFLCNPKMMDRTANQRTMDSFRYGCQSLIDIFPQMMLRRIDLAMFAARFDIENKSKLYKRKESLTPSVISSKHMKALVHYAWNLQPENIIFDDNVADYVREKAFELSNEFGQCTDLPLVCPEDFRKTLARIATAFAIIDLSSDDDMQSITVTDRHVSYVADTFLKQSYSALNCRLNQYSNQYRSQNVLLSNEKEQMYLNFLAELNSREEGSAKRMLYMFREIAGMDINEKTKATQREFSEHLLCDMRTIRKDMAWFVKNNLIKSSRGYMPLNKCIIFYNYCLDEDAKKKTDSERLFI